MINKSFTCQQILLFFFLLVIIESFFIPVTLWLICHICFCLTLKHWMSVIFQFGVSSILDPFGIVKAKTTGFFFSSQIVGNLSPAIFCLCHFLCLPRLLTMTGRKRLELPEKYDLCFFFHLFIRVPSRLGAIPSLGPLTLIFTTDLVCIPYRGLLLLNDIISLLAMWIELHSRSSSSSSRFVWVDISPNDVIEAILFVLRYLWASITDLLHQSTFLEICRSADFGSEG